MEKTSTACTHWYGVSSEDDGSLYFDEKPDGSPIYTFAYCPKCGSSLDCEETDETED